MTDWNVVITVHNGCYRQAHDLLQQFGPVTKTEFFNILVMRIVDLQAFMEDLSKLSKHDPEIVSCLARVVPVMYTFTYQTPAEFELKAKQTVTNWIPTLTGKKFHIRMHRRGFKGRISSMEEEKLLDEYLLEALQMAGNPGKIAFEDPDAIIALETVGTHAGLSLWTREDLQKYPYLHMD